MENENNEDGQTDEPQEADLQDDAERGPGVLGRIRGSFGAAGKGVSGAVDTVTGAGFREQFEDFTEAVTTTVIGVHQDQAALRESISRLEQSSLQEHTELKERLSQFESLGEREQAELKERLSRLEVGTQQGQAELRESVSRLEQSFLKEHTALHERLSQLDTRAQQENVDLRERLSRLGQRSPLPTWVVVSGVASGLALVCGVIALLMSL